MDERPAAGAGDGAERRSHPGLPAGTSAAWTIATGVLGISGVSALVIYGCAVIMRHPPAMADVAAKPEPQIVRPVTPAATATTPDTLESTVVEKAFDDFIPLMASVPSHPRLVFDQRTGGCRKRAVIAGGASQASEAAVEDALRWQVQHQATNGAWPVQTYQENCTEGPRCEPGLRRNGGSDDIESTALVVLSFLGAGYDQRMPSRYRSTIAKAIAWLIALQGTDGRLRIADEPALNEAQATAVMALCEAYAVTQDPQLRTAAEAGIRNLLACRVPALPPSTLPWGWDAQVLPADLVATMPTCWCLQALWAGREAGLPIADGWESGEQWLPAAWMASARRNGRMREIPAPDEGELTYGYLPAADRAVSMASAAEIGVGHGWSPTVLDAGPANRTGPAGLLIGLLQQRPAGDPLIESLADGVMRHHLPTTGPIDSLACYCATWSMFRLGGARWQRWNGTVRYLLVRTQRPKGAGCFSGSWDPSPEDRELGISRPMATALNTLSLEVYYRYVATTRPEAMPAR